MPGVPGHVTPSAPRAEPSDVDRALVARCLRGEPKAFEALVGRFSRLVHSVVLRTLQRHGERPDDDRLSDLFSASFLALIDGNARRLGQWDGRCTLASWVRLIAASTVADRLRAERRATKHLGVEDAVEVESLPADAVSALEIAARAERMARLERAMERLSESDRTLLRLLYMEEVPSSDAAVRLGIAAGALYTRKNRALARLRAMWDAVAEGDDERL